MKTALKKTLIKSNLIYPYRAAKYLGASLRPKNLISNIRYRSQGAHDNLPIPPAYLIYLIINKPSIAEYFRGGEITASSIKNLLNKNQIPLEGLKSILDFGCGCGRVLRNFSHLQDTKLHGTDLNPKPINWCKNNFTFANFSQNQLEPPLNYLDQSFDFTYLISVFTHLPRAVQIKWLHEFHRITKDDKYILITLHGQNLFKELTPEEQEKFQSQGYVERGLDKPGSNHFGTFHTLEHFQEMINGLFKIVDVSYGGQPNHPYQDLYLLQKTQ